VEGEFFITSNIEYRTSGIRSSLLDFSLLAPGAIG